MIPNTQPYVAWYITAHPEGELMTWLPVVAWGDDGCPLVVDTRDKLVPRLAPAHTLEGFDGLSIKVITSEDDGDNMELLGP